MSKEILAVRFKRNSLDEFGRFAGIAGVFGSLVEKDQSVLMPGCFKRTLSSWGERYIPLTWNHNSDEIIGGIKGQETEDGLAIEGQFTMTAKGSDIYKLVKEERVTGLSIGFSVIPDKMEIKKNAEGNGIVRYLREVKLWEVAITPWPADEGATITSVHNNETEVSELMNKLATLEHGTSEFKETLEAIFQKFSIVRNADPDIESTQPQPSTDAPGSDASTAVNHLREMHESLARMWRTPNVKSVERTEDRMRGTSSRGE